MAELGVHQSALLTDLALCINRYRLFSPGWYVCVMAKVQLSAEEWEVPGLVAMVNYGRKKQCEVRDEVFQGPPNFVLDVFDFPDDEDFVRRRDRFCKAGVHEYFVALNDEPVTLLWYRLEGANIVHSPRVRNTGSASFQRSPASLNAKITPADTTRQAVRSMVVRCSSTKTKSPPNAAVA